MFAMSKVLGSFEQDLAASVLVHQNGQDLLIMSKFIGADRTVPTSHLANCLLKKSVVRNLINKIWFLMFRTILTFIFTTSEYYSKYPPHQTTGCGWSEYSFYTAGVKFFIYVIHDGP